MAKYPAFDGLMERVSREARVRSDRERTLYVTTRKALNPHATVTRRRAARRVSAPPFEIPRDTGYSLFPAGRFPEAAEVAAAARELATHTTPERFEKANKEFMIPLLTGAELDSDSPFIRFALREDVLAAVTAYLGVAPILASINVYSSLAPKRDKLISSQLFHCDGDDTTQVKVFVLCSDVDQGNGPTRILDAQRSRRIRRAVNYRYGKRVTDEQAQEVLGGDVQLASVVGDPGTVCFADTSRCFHYGSRVEHDAEPRLAAIFQYLTPFSFMLPRDPRKNAPFRHLAAPGEGHLRSLVLGAA
jgi:hypothetical protein